MAIHLVKEPEGYGALERCYFCSTRTNMWHAGTNQPVCKKCAKIHKTCELTKSSPYYKPQTKAEYLKN